MSGNFYQVLLFSLMFTAGAVLIYFGYRYFMARWGSKPSAFRYVTLHNLERGAAKGEIIFYFHVPEELHLKVEVLDLEDKVLITLEDKLFSEGDFRVKYDTLTLSDGDYFYRISTPHQNTAKKFTVKNG
jgi:hypothetical protein